MKEIRPIKNTWNDWLLDYIPEPIIKIAFGLKDKIVSLFTKKTPEQTMYGTGKKPSQPKKENKKKLKIE